MDCDTASYVSPIRRVVLFLGQLGPAWHIDAVATMARVEPSRAAAYLTMLAKGGVVRVDRARGLAYRSRRWSTWARNRPRQRPGGNALRYRRAIAGVYARLDRAHVVGTPAAMAEAQRDVVRDTMANVAIPMPTPIAGALAPLARGEPVPVAALTDLVVWAEGL